MTTHEVRCNVNAHPILHFVANLLINDCAIGDLQRPWRLVCMPITSPHPMLTAPYSRAGNGAQLYHPASDRFLGHTTSRKVSSVCTR